MDKKPCIACGTLTLLATFGKTGGLCMPCFKGRCADMGPTEPSRESGGSVTFAPSDKVEVLRPFIDQFWLTVLETSYTTSFVSNESTFDSWEQCAGGRMELIKRVKQVYSVDITPYYNEPIPTVLKKIRDGAERQNLDIDKLHHQHYTFQETPVIESEKQKLIREHRLILWPDYRGSTCTTVWIFISIIILGILGGSLASLLPYNRWFNLLAMLLIFSLYFPIIDAFFIIQNIPIRKRWQARIGQVIPWSQVEKLTRGNRKAWALIAAPKISRVTSFGTYHNFGYGWDAIVLLNLHSSEKFIVSGKWEKIESLAEKGNLRTLP